MNKDKENKYKNSVIGVEDCFGISNIPIFAFQYELKKHNSLRFDDHKKKESIQISTVFAKI